MNSWKNALKCILIGGLAATVSCSAIRMTKKNMKVQSTGIDTTSKILKPASAPAIIIKSINMPNASQSHVWQRKYDFKPFKDSLMNALGNMHSDIQSLNQSVDTGLKNQSVFFNDVHSMANTINKMGTVIDLLLYKVEGLERDKTKLIKYQITSNAVKDDATIGNTFSQYGFYILCFIAMMVSIIFVLILLLTFKHSRLHKTT